MRQSGTIPIAPAVWQCNSATDRKQKQMAQPDGHCALQALELPRFCAFIFRLGICAGRDTGLRPFPYACAPCRLPASITFNFPPRRGLRHKAVSQAIGQTCGKPAPHAQAFLSPPSLRKPIWRSQAWSHLIR
jgi:hypothetical protein